jgi:hypothetical protein
MCVHAPQSSEALGRDTRSSEVGHLDLLGIPDHDVFDLALSIYKYTDLPSGLERDLGHLPGKFLRNDLCRRDASRGKALDAAKLIMFEALCIPRDAADKTESSSHEYSKVVSSLVLGPLS